MINTINAEPVIAELSYFEKRMQVLGITPEINKISLHKTELQTGIAIMQEVPIFREVEEGIDILVYTLERLTIRIEKHGSRMKKDFSLVRLEHPITKGNDYIKYRIPKGGGTQPFFPPALIEKYENNIPIPKLYMIEGYFKAFKGSMHGIDIIGLSSITHMKDKQTQGLHPDIIKLLKTGLVGKIIWLTDGDCLDITSKEISEEKDLYTRPRNFYSSITKFKDLLDDFNIDKWFMHVDSDSIMDNYGGGVTGLMRENVKGLDDLICSFPDKAADIVADIESFSTGGTFFKKFNITYGMSAVYKHFHIGDVNDFYLFHVERRPELKGIRFKFIGTKYQYDDNDGKCKIQIPGEASHYFRVGDNYFKFIALPNQYHQTERVFVQRKKTTITDDHGKNFCQHIPKYEAFCNVPDHNSFKQVIDNCFNVYSPIDFVPDDEQCFPEDFPSIMNMVNHIFGGDKLVSYTDKLTKVKKEYTMREMGLDYLQILYQYPNRKLPILCLVSRENNTGKTTLGNFLRQMLGANVAIVGNADLSNDFNAHWASKSVVVCDETKIDKHAVIEKIKMLSTAKKIFMNAKGQGQVELDCFIKFILVTNNEDNFISISIDDVRYWILKVPQLQHDNPNIMSQFVEEMPAFLSFLNSRKLATEEMSRMWFHFDLLKTEAAKRVIEYSLPFVEKEIRRYMKELFIETGLDQIMMSLAAVHKEIFNNSGKYDKNYLGKIISDMKVQTYHVWGVIGIDKREYKTEEEALAAAGVLYPDNTGHMLLAMIKPKPKVIRYDYPKWKEIFVDGKPKMERYIIKEPPSRPYVFLRKDFVKPEDQVELDIGEDNYQLAQMMNDSGTPAVIQEDLPF